MPDIVVCHPNFSRRDLGSMLVLNCFSRSDATRKQVSASRDGHQVQPMMLMNNERTRFEPPEHAPGEPCACHPCGVGPFGPPHVYLFTGEVVYAAADLHIRGRGLDFVWARKYRSQLGPSTAQGNGWDFSYNI